MTRVVISIPSKPVYIIEVELTGNSKVKSEAFSKEVIELLKRLKLGIAHES